MYPTPAEEQNSNPIDLFINHVSIAGLQEAFGPRSTPLEKWLFRVSLFLASLAAAFSIYTIVHKYSGDDSNRVYDDFDINHRYVPFPNVTICGPEIIKSSVIEKMIQDHHGDLHNAYNMAEVVDYIRILTSYNMRPKPVPVNVTRVLVKLASEGMQGRPNGVLDVYAEVYPKCSEMFSECRFGMDEVDCCRGTELLLFDERICYHFALDRIQQSQLSSNPDSPINDPIHASQSGFALRARIAWPDVMFWDELAADGFNVFIGALASPWFNPIAIPAGMDATVVLAPPERLSELTGCRSMDASLPEMTYAQYYDPYGVGCIGEELAKGLLKAYGCMSPGLNYTPRNGTGLCTMGQLLGLLSLINGEAFKNTKPVLSVDGVDKMETMMRDGAIRAFAQCPQFCTRYIYDVISASYAEIMPKQGGGSAKNESWSRIRFFFPTATYHVHAEKLASPTYMAICEIGGIFGVYAGLSMVAGCEIVAYGLAVCVKYKQRKTKVIAIELNVR